MIAATAEHWQCSIEQYHASPGESNSKLSDYLADPALYHAKHIAKTYIEPAKDCYKIGSSVHEQVLLDTLEGKAILIPDEVLNDQGHRKGKEWLQFKEENDDKYLLNAAEYATVQRYVDALMANRTARKVIEACLRDGTTEYSTRWTDGETGLPCRCRFDLFHPAIDADIKTCRDNSPAAFAKSIFNFGYHRQRAFYGDGSVRIRGGEVVPFWFFAVTQFSCRVYTLNDVFEEMGQAEVRKALDGIKRCRDTGVWTDGTEEDPIALAPPGYAFTNQAYEVDNDE